jgi:hypothetical protein
MAHYAFLDDNNIVLQVITGRDEDDLAQGVTSWEDYYGAFRGLRCLRTSYNTQGNQHVLGGEPFRGNYAGIGWTYDEDLDAFIAPKLYDSWLLDGDTFLWVAPVAYPEDGNDYAWDEDAGNWVEVPEV